VLAEFDVTIAQRFDVVTLLCVLFSAKGTAFMAAWGSAPGNRKCKTASAEHSFQKEYPGVTTQARH
jgi:hypothetical protein